VGLGYGNSMQPSVAILADCRYFGVSTGIQIKKISHELFTLLQSSEVEWKTPGRFVDYDQPTN